MTIYDTGLVPPSPINPLWCHACQTTHEDLHWYSLGMICGRCNQHTGNNHQGHYWKFCKVTGTYREFHFCCPSECELET